MSTRALLAALAVVLLVASVCRAQNSSALINEALDKQVRLDLNGVLPRAMEAIEKETGVPIRVTPAVYELLPWGEQTNITAKIENKTLREALQAITQKLGLTFVLTDEAVEIQPVPALMRLGRRSTIQELQALDLLTSVTLEIDNDRPTVRELTEAVDKKLEALNTPYAIENRADQAAPPDAPIAVARNATLADALESIHKSTGATWYPWGKTVLLVPKEDQVRLQLSKTITTRYNGVDVSQVLMELSRQSGVNFSIEPGAIQRIPPEFRNVRLVLESATITQALESLAGFTGLGYVVNENGVYLWNQSSGSAGGGTGARDPIVGIVQLDNGMQVLIPQSQVPAELREYLRHKTQKELEKIRHMMEEENFQPTTQPATAPSNEDL